MRDLRVLFVHLIVTVVRLAKPGGLRAVVAESVLTRHQILILNRSRKRAPNLRVLPIGHRRFMHPAHAPFSRAAMWHCPKTIDAAAFPSPPDETKVSHAVFVRARTSAWSEGTGQRIDRCRRCNETT